MSSLFEKSEMSAALRHLLPAYHSRECLSEYSLNHGLEDQIQNKNRVRPCGRTLPSQFTIWFVDNNRELHIANRSLRMSNDRKLQAGPRLPRTVPPKMQNVFDDGWSADSRYMPRISTPFCSSCQRHAACVRSSGLVSSFHLPSCWEAALFFPFRSLLVHQRVHLADF